MATSQSSQTSSTTTPASSDFGKYLAALTGSQAQNQNPMFNPTTTSETSLGITSQQDITSIINSTMQQLVGRFATPEEIQRYGSELLAAERENPGSYSALTTYKNTGATPNRRNTVTGERIYTGVDPSSFIANLINGTGEARDYKAATGYFDVMQQSNNKFRSAFSG